MLSSPALPPARSRAVLGPCPVPNSMLGLAQQLLDDPPDDRCTLVGVSVSIVGEQALYDEVPRKFQGLVEVGMKVLGC